MSTPSCWLPHASLEDVDRSPTSHRPPTPPPTKHKSSTCSPLPSHLNRLLDLHKSIEHSLSIALATASVGFTPSSGKDGNERSHMPNVTDHISLAASGSARRLSVEDLSRLVWLWEWDGESLPDRAAASLEIINDDPFVDIPKGWTRGGMGIIISQTTHTSRAQGTNKRVPAYGLGIEVQTKSVVRKDMAGVAQWTAAAASRREEVAARLEHWVKLHTQERVKHRETARASSPTPTPIPNVPFSALPRLNVPVVAVPKSALARDLLDPTARKGKTPSLMRTPTSGRLAFPSTPSSSSSVSSSSSRPVSPVKALLGDPFSSRPTTPTTPRQNTTVPQTPTTSRRAAFMERVRLKSMNTPSKGAVQVLTRNSEGEEFVRTIGQEDVKKRLLLGRLPNVAEAVWMFV